MSALLHVPWSSYIMNMIPDIGEMALRKIGGEPEKHRQKKLRNLSNLSMAPSGAFFSKVFSSSVLSMAPVMAPPGRSSVNCSVAWKTTQGSLVALLQWSGGMFQSSGSQSWRIVWDVDFPMKPGVMIYHDISDMSITNMKSMYVPTATQTALCTKRIR